MPELNPLFVKCAMRELAMTGYPQAEFDDQLAVIRPDPREPNLVMNDRVVRNFGRQLFPGDTSMDELEALRQRCAQMTETYMAAESVEVAINRYEKLLVNFNGSALTAREVEDGIGYCVWEYDSSQTWFHYLNPRDTRDYTQAKRMFCLQSGMLISNQFDIRLSEAENDSLRRQAGTLATGHGLTLQHLAMLGASNFRLKTWGDDPSSPAVVPTLTAETLTPAGMEEWQDVLSASVSGISGPLPDNETGPTVTLCEQADGQRVLDFGNLLAGNCTPEQQALWVQHPAAPANGYEWPSLMDEPNESAPVYAMPGNIHLEAISKEETPLLFDSDAGTQIGCLGHLRGDFDKSGHFHHSWFGAEQEAPPEFKAGFDDAMKRLRDGPLQSLKHLQNTCWGGAASRLSETGRPEYGMKFACGAHSYYMRLIPDAGTYNVYIYAYDTPALEQYLSGQEQGQQEPGMEQPQRQEPEMTM